MVSVNILYNDIGVEQAKVLASILKEHSTLKSLCGNKGDETELDMAGSVGKWMGADGAIMLAPETFANEAMTSLNMSNNSLGGSTNEYSTFTPDMAGIKALAAVIPECK